MTRIKDLIVSSKSKHSQNDKLQHIKKKLAQNSLVELKLGFDDNEFRSKRDIQSLIKVINEQFYHQVSLHKHSCLKSISIGWRLPKFALGSVLQSVIPALLQEPVRITHLQLVLNDNPPIPEWCLRRIISWHSLESLDLRSISLRVPVVACARLSSRIPPMSVMMKKQPTACSKSAPKHQLQQRVDIIDSSANTRTSTNTNTTTSSSIKDDSNDSMDWKIVNIVEIVPHISSRVRSLKFMNCGITKQHIPELCESIRRRLYVLKKLSLRQNFTLDGGYHHLFALLGIKILDLSLCDLDTNDGYRIARAIEKFENKDLELLSLAGNYRLSTAVPDIVGAAGTKLMGIDCSFCGVNFKSQQKIFDILSEESTPSSPLLHKDSKCTIQYFRMQGVMPCDIEGLIKCICHNTSIRHLVVNNHREVQSISLEAMQKVASAIEWNYSLEVLKFDVIPMKHLDILESIEFWLKLNRCGRRALLQTNKGVDSWSNILSQGVKSNDRNILFWLLKHGSVMFT